MIKVRCRVPSCGEDREQEDCCHGHSVGQARRGDWLPNDGVIDWTAVEIAAQGARRVVLTWVEGDIAAALMMSRGHGASEIRSRTGIWTASMSPMRRSTLQGMADAIAKEGYGRE